MIWFVGIGVTSAMAFLIKPDSVVLFGGIVLVEFTSRIKRIDKHWFSDLAVLGVSSLLVIGLFLASFMDPDRIVRYLFFQYKFLFFVASITERTWNKPMVFRHEFIFFFLVAASLGLWKILGKWRLPKYGWISAWLAVYGILTLVSLSLRPIYYQHNLYFPSLVPAVLAGLGLEGLRRSSSRFFKLSAVILVLGMAASAVVSVVVWNHRGFVKSRLDFQEIFDETFLQNENCTVSLREILLAPHVFKMEKPAYRLTLEDQARLFSFLSSMKGDSLHVYDGFEAATPLRGVPYLNGFVLNAFHEIKYQKAYDFLKKRPGILGKRLHESGWQMFHDMKLTDAKKALLTELIQHPPEILMMDAFIWKLATEHSYYAEYLDERYTFFLLPDAHSIVGLGKGRAFPPPSSSWCNP